VKLRDATADDLPLLAELNHQRALGFREEKRSFRWPSSRAV
jgi:hypothetical protein